MVSFLLKASAVCIVLGLWGVPAMPAAGQTNLIPNPTFRDQDGDGKVDGWEVKTFIFEADRLDPRRYRLTLKIPQESDRQIVGEVSTLFQGPSGYYRVTIRYLDENDGISLGKLLVNGKVIHLWDFDNIFFNYYRNEVIENVQLNPGDRLTLWAANDFTEYCRLDSIQVVPSPTPPSVRDLEAMRPPPVAEVTFGHLVALRDRRDLSAEDMRQRSRLVCERGAVVFAAREGEKVVVELSPNSARQKTLDEGALSFLGAEATGLEAGTAVGVPRNRAYDPETQEGYDGFIAPQTGLYRYEFRGATPSMDVPHVFCAPSDSKGTPALSGWGDFYCFVPRGTASFAVTASALGNRSTEVQILTPAGTLCKRTCLEPREELAVRVPQGQDDGVWMIAVRGVSPRVAVRGIPAFLASHPKYMLVPGESVSVAR